jgi:hypothetical protein
MDDPGWGGFTPLPSDGTPPPPDAAGASQPAPPRGPGGGARRPSQPLLIGSVAVAVVVVVAIVLALSLGGGGGKSKAAVATTTAPTLATTSPTTAAPTPTTIPAPTTLPGESLASAASTYLTLEGPAYSSLTAFGSDVAGWKTVRPSAAEAQNEANPTVAAFNHFTSQLLARTWPSAIQPKINNLASQVEIVANDLADIRLAFANGTLSAWATQFDNDGDALGTDVNAVRAALNLPPIPTD